MTPPVPFNLAPPAPAFPWPGGARSALFIGFDVDAETVWFGNAPDNADRLVTLSRGGYDGRVGIARTAALLDELKLKATFFVPGWTALAHRDACEAILAGGHEIGHHGYLHRRPERSDLDAAREEVDRGFEALHRAFGLRPSGYRAPSGEVFPELLAYLAASGIRYTSSFRDDVRPYRHRLAGGAPGPVEIPVDDALDDWNFGMTSRSDPRPLAGRDTVLPLWIDAFEAIHAWGGVTSLMLHPQVSGRPMCWHLLRDVLRHVLAKGDVWVATGAEIARHYETCEAEASAKS